MGMVAWTAPEPCDLEGARLWMSWWFLVGVAEFWAEEMWREA